MNNTTKRTVYLGNVEMTYPSPELQELHDSTHIKDNPEQLRNELQDKGYILIRQFFDRDKVLAVREEVLRYIRDSGEEKLDSAYPWHEGVLNHRCGLGCIPMMEGKNELTHSQCTRAVLESEEAYSFFERLFGEDALTFDYKWLRGVHTDAFTGAHVDNVYMGRGSNKLHTLWTPFGDIPVEMGVLAICEASHRLPGFQKFQETYGNLDIEKENLHGSGWFTSDPRDIQSKFGGVWKTTDFKAGDVLIFNMRTVHMSTSNKTNKVRISCDTRWQPRSHTADERFMGDIGKVDPKFGLAGEKQKSMVGEVTMSELRRRWGLE